MRYYLHYCVILFTLFAITANADVAGDKIKNDVNIPYSTDESFQPIEDMNSDFYKDIIFNRLEGNEISYINKFDVSSGINFHDIDNDNNKSNSTSDRGLIKDYSTCVKPPAPVPEPATLILLAAGLISAGIASRKKRQP
ncbi:MAG: PEP-CTERM sorting domain-containing protein [candidate division Zixibacteria bacterium]|nr:PEP-CTERM sorting domain-containing protein [candidate division Zixibacteria bacterium]